MLLLKFNFRCNFGFFTNFSVRRTSILSALVKSTVLLLPKTFESEVKGTCMTTHEILIPPPQMGYLVSISVQYETQRELA